MKKAQVLLFSLIAAATPLLSAAADYLAYLESDGQMAGTAVFKTANRRDGSRTVAATFQPLNGKKFTLKDVLPPDGGNGLDALSGVTFADDRVEGTVDMFTVKGAIDASRSKNTPEAAILGAFKGKVYVVCLKPGDASAANSYACLSVAFSAKGKAKVSGTLPDGAKASRSCQLIVCGNECWLPVALSQNGTLGFLLKFSGDGSSAQVTAMTDWKGKGFSVPWDEAMVADLSGIDGTQYLNMERSPAEIRGMEVVKWLLPVNEPVMAERSKWKTQKAERVTLKDGVPVFGANPAGVKLTYSAKTGLFKGSLVFYAVDKNKLKRVAATISGVVVDGQGYGTVTVKRFGSWPIVINGNKVDAPTPPKPTPPAPEPVDATPPPLAGTYVGWVNGPGGICGDMTVVVKDDGAVHASVRTMEGSANFQGTIPDIKEATSAELTLKGGNGRRMTLAVSDYSDEENFWDQSHVTATISGGFFGSGKYSVSYGQKDAFAKDEKDQRKYMYNAANRFMMFWQGSYTVYCSDVGTTSDTENLLFKNPVTFKLLDDGYMRVDAAFGGERITGKVKVLLTDSTTGEAVVFFHKGKWKGNFYVRFSDNGDNFSVDGGAYISL